MWTLALLVSAIMVVGCANKYTTSGKIAYNRKDFDKAIEDFKLALQADSSNAEAYLYLGKAYKEKNDTERRRAREISACTSRYSVRITL